MSYFNIKALLLLSSPVGEKDKIYEFLTEDNTILKIKEYGAQHTGGKCFSLFSTGQIYVYRKDNSDLCVLTDCELLVNRTSAAIKYSVDMIPFIKIIKYFQKYFIKDLFENINYIIDKMDSGDSSGDKNIKMFVYLIEKIFISLGNYRTFDICSVCAKELQRNEIAGLSSSLYSPTCHDCSDVKDVLLPGMRRYLDYILKLGFEDAINVSIYQKDLKRILDFECMRLRLINKNLFSDIESYFSSDLSYAG